MNKLTPALLVALCLPAGAQEFGASVNDALRAVKLQAAPMAPGVVRPGVQQARHQSALDETLTAMNDGPEIGGQVVSYLQDRKIEIRFEDQQALSRTDGKAIVLSLAIGVYPRVIGPRLAWEAAQMMEESVPESAEKEYMRRSIAARVFLELGGDEKDLPVMEYQSGDKDEELAREMKLWLDNKAEAALEKIGESSKKPTLQELMSAQQDPDEKAAIGVANARFNRFLMEEAQWRQANGR